MVTTESLPLSLRQITIAKASGPDYFPNWVLKEYVDILAPAVTDIIDNSFQKCKVPSAWKLADILPVPKASMVEDFHKRLTLTSILSKVAEGYVIERDLKPTLLKSMDPSFLVLSQGHL